MGVPEAVALEIPAEEGSPPARVPPRVRRRLLRARGGSDGAAPTAEEIEAKLRQAHLRRQQFHEELSSKARCTLRSPSWSYQGEDVGQRLEAKLVAAKQNGLSLLAKEQRQLAKRQRAEHLKKRGSPHSSMRSISIKNGEFLSRKLAICWRRFITSRKTTVVLARAFDALGVNQRSVVSMPFDELALFIESPTVLQTTKALLDRLESRFVLSQSSSSSKTENIDHLLKHLGSPKRRILPSSAGRTKATLEKAVINSDTSKLPRYSLKVVLCAYMILGHPKSVLSEQGEREKLLVESAENFMKEFELLVKTILDGLDGACILRQSMLDVGSPGPSNCQESSSIVAERKKFRTQLVAFDTAWCAYLYHFVAWKGKDAKSLEEDLIRAACKLEMSMMQTCKIATKGQSDNLGGDLKVIQKQVVEDQKLLRERIRHLGGEAGIERMESALSETRSKFFGAKKNGSPIASTVANVALPPSSNMDAEKTSRVVKSLFRVSSSASESSKRGNTINTTLSSAMPEKMPTENERMVNEILHDVHRSFAEPSDNMGTVEGDFKAKVKETMERAFWDVVADSMRGDMPDYSHLVNLVKEVREALHELAPTEWKEEISNNINLEILSQVLESGSQDRQYLGQILHYSLGMLRKLSSPAKEDEMKKSHDKLLGELIEDPESDYRGPNSFVVSVIKGLRFTMEELKALKAEVSRARIQLLEPIIKGSGGVEYLQKFFADRYGSPFDALSSLPLTAQWISSLKDVVEEEWNEHVSTFSILPATNHPLVATLRTGRGVPDGVQSALPGADSTGLPECMGERLGKLIRIGLLQLISSVEGIQRQSVSETFKLNWLRLRSVQSKFQQVIVIATSMLVLHQVLLSENPKIAPSELENAALELFDMLTKVLDNFSDVGTEKIIEVMMHSSTSTSTSSDEMIETRKQILTRVFLKSLQTDDTIFKKVSRSVYCAFRAITLGGSGAKGLKLADAALRRIGATKLTDQVAKAAEVLIKAAMISEQVHETWYAQFL